MLLFLRGEFMKYIIKDYQKKDVFSSFLPGISGPNGIPIWAFYVNRGQAITSFGIQNKDRSIMDFDSAHIAYKTVEREGFRTFIKYGDSYYEPFQRNSKTQMTILPNSIELVDSHELFDVKVRYQPVMNKDFPGLIREVEVSPNFNVGTIEVFDGMPELIPFGLNQDVLKNIPQTVSAWMEVDRYKKVPLFRTRISIEDKAEVKYNSEAHYYISIMDGEVLETIVDPQLIFLNDRSFEKPYAIFSEEEKVERTQNFFPCGFTHIKNKLSKGNSLKFFSVIGYVNTNQEIPELINTLKDERFLYRQKQINNNLIEELLSDVETKTGNDNFDNYIKQSYLDNFLRGGYPYVYSIEKPLYLYGRKHGDLERDYNYFEIEDSFYSQGNGNYRDVNQNRRNDLFFNPKLNDINIRQFMSLIQLDGYNPLVIEPNRFIYKGGLDLYEYMNKIPEDILGTPFTFAELMKKVDLIVDENVFIKKLIDHCELYFDATFQEGYWVDHWTYNLDLIEDYLGIYPDKLDSFINKKHYTWFKSNAYIRPRHERYVKTEHGLRQYNSLEISEYDHNNYVVDENNELILSNLIEKLMLLHANKIATLDKEGVGIEMEAGKPGWYDALNGLPGIFGSSVMEFYELVRLNQLMISLLSKTTNTDFEFHQVLIDYVRQVSLLCESEINTITYWNKANEIKETFREKQRDCISSSKEIVDKKEILTLLYRMESRLEYGLDKLEKITNLGFGSYFYYENNEKQVALPPFLEGAVNYMKISDNPKAVFEVVKNKSGLYDEKLEMYKVNSSLSKMTLDLGRCRAFTPGWLENESVWMHMEYKYLLTMLEKGLYEEFIKSFKKAAIPFQNPETYGRSIYENVSFIASSANPDESIHGRGFIARLTGSTAEMLSIWKNMFFGSNIYRFDKEKGLVFNLSPLIPNYLINGESQIFTTLHSKIKLIYHLGELEEVIPGKYRIAKFVLDDLIEIKDDVITGKHVTLIRNQQIKKIDVFLEKNET